MKTPNSNEPAKDDKLISLFSHLSIFLGAVILPIILWAIYKDKSRFIKFNAMQALFFQLLYTIIITLFGLFLAFLSILADDFNYDRYNGGLSPQLIFGWLFLLGLAMFLFYIPAVYIGIKSYKGKISKYFIIGNIVYNKVYGNQ